MMNTFSQAHQAAQYIQNRVPDFTPRIGLVLGSGLGKVVDEIIPTQVIDYAELPGFPISTVKGHSGSFLLGTLHGTPIACLQGRSHLYEGTDPMKTKTWIRTLKLLGCSMLLLTNAAGSLHPDIKPGSLMMLTDHINFQFTNPLIGPNDEEFGPRFFAMNNAYDFKLRESLGIIARELNIRLAEGVYLATTGPMYETPAEIRAYRTLGADAVGMSTAAEVIVARHCGLRVAAISAITNLAAGMSDIYPSHEETLEHAAIAVRDLSRIIGQFIKNF